MKNCRDFYRSSVGIALINEHGQLWTGQRHKNDQYWQMPQGGIGDSETVYQAFYREIREELGLLPKDLEIIREHNEWLKYDFPEHLCFMQKLDRESARCIGQRQKWILCALKTDDDAIDIDQGKFREFVSWCWRDPATLPDLVIEFKRNVYKQLIRAIEPYVQKYVNSSHRQRD